MNNDFTKDDVKEFLLYADALTDKIIYEYTSSNKVVGQYDNIDVFEIKGDIL